MFPIRCAGKLRFSTILLLDPSQRSCPVSSKRTGLLCITTAETLRQLRILRANGLAKLVTSPVPGGGGGQMSNTGGGVIVIRGPSNKRRTPLPCKASTVRRDTSTHHANKGARNDTHPTTTTPQPASTNTN